jgi:hypothetical protein
MDQQKVEKEQEGDRRDRRLQVQRSETKQRSGRTTKAKTKTLEEQKKQLEDAKKMLFDNIDKIQLVMKTIEDGGSLKKENLSSEDPAVSEQAHKAATLWREYNRSLIYTLKAVVACCEGSIPADDNEIALIAKIQEMILTATDESK